MLYTVWLQLYQYMDVVEGLQCTSWNEFPCPHSSFSQQPFTYLHPSYSGYPWTGSHAQAHTPPTHTHLSHTPKYAVHTYLYHSHTSPTPLPHLTHHSHTPFPLWNTHSDASSTSYFTCLYWYRISTFWKHTFRTLLHPPAEVLCNVPDNQKTSHHTPS